MQHDHHGRTHRLELVDQSIRDWTATVLASDRDDGIVLDRSAFYPGGGGQPPDRGVLVWGGVQTHIVGVRKKDDLWLIPADFDPIPTVGTSVRGAIDDLRRSMLMRTHSALHVLCGVMFRDHGVPVTGGNMEPGEARLDFDFQEVPPGFKENLTEAINAEVAADRAIAIKLLPREEAYALGDIIKTATDLLPPELQVVRLVDIDGLDLQADGGTHVASTSQIGRVEVAKVENKGRGFRRVRIRLPE